MTLRRIPLPLLLPGLLLLVAACSSDTGVPASPAAGHPAAPGQAGAQEANEQVGPKQPARTAELSNPALRNPRLATAQAPETFKVRFETTKGPFVVMCERKLAPNGADRFYNLVKIGFFEDVAFFRAIPGFMVQFGLRGDPTIDAAWRTAPIADDEVKVSNQRGFLTFASAGPGTRTTQMFINLVNNHQLDDSFAPIGRVLEGMAVVDQLYTGYGESAPRGRGPTQEGIEREGNVYLRRNFDKLDYIESATVIE